MKVLDAVVKEAISILKDTKKFVKEQMSDLHIQMLKNGTITTGVDLLTYFIMLCVGGILGWGSVYFYGLAITNSRSSIIMDSLGYSLLCGILGLASITMICAYIPDIMSCIQTLLQIKYAPKIYMIEYLHTLVTEDDDDE